MGYLMCLYVMGGNIYQIKGNGLGRCDRRGRGLGRILRIDLGN